MYKTSLFVFLISISVLSFITLVGSVILFISSFNDFYLLIWLLSLFGFLLVFLSFYFFSKAINTNKYRYFLFSSICALIAPSISLIFNIARFTLLFSTLYIIFYDNKPINK